MPSKRNTNDQPNLNYFEKLAQKSVNRGANSNANPFRTNRSVLARAHTKALADHVGFKGTSDQTRGIHRTIYSPDSRQMPQIRCILF